MNHLLFNNYGKTDVRLTQVVRDGSRHDLIEITVKILFQGDFESSYTEGDNSKVLPTDTMKNTVYVIARQKPIRTIENFAHELATHFLHSVPHLTQVVVEVVERPWNRFEDYGSTFVQAGSERRFTVLTATATNETYVSGIRGLEILKTSDSAFVGFMKDAYTSLPETKDRLLGTVLDADWSYGPGDIDFESSHKRIRHSLLEAFANHHSLSVQHTMFAMGLSVTKSFPEIAEIHLIMPNKHRIIFDLARFSLDNPNQVFVSTDEPSGFIEVRMAGQSFSAGKPE